MARPAWAGGGGRAPLQKLLPGNPEQPAANAANPSATASKARLVASACRVSPRVLPDTPPSYRQSRRPFIKAIMWANVRQVKARGRAGGGLADAVLKASLIVRRSAPHNRGARAGIPGRSSRMRARLQGMAGYLIATLPVWSD